MDTIDLTNALSINADPIIRVGEIDYQISGISADTDNGRLTIELEALAPQPKNPADGLPIRTCFSNYMKIWNGSLAENILNGLFSWYRVPKDEAREVMWQLLDSGDLELYPDGRLYLAGTRNA